MANSKAISVRIPDELLSKIDLLAQEKYKSHKGTPNRSLVILDAIVEYFNTLSDTENKSNVTMSDNVTVTQFQELQSFSFTLHDTVEDLKDRLFLVEKTLAEDVLVTIKSIEKKSSKSNRSNEQIEEWNNSTTSLQLELSDNVSEIFKPVSGVLLSARLGQHKFAASNRKSKKTLEEFYNWSKENDPDEIGWIPNPEGSGFIPKNKLRSDLFQKLKAWIADKT